MKLFPRPRIADALWSDLAPKPVTANKAKEAFVSRAEALLFVLSSEKGGRR